MKIFLYLAAIVFLASCTQENGDTIDAQNVTLQTYLKSKNLTYEKVGSIYHVVKTGSYGYYPNNGDTVVFNYTEYLYNGTTPITSNVLDTLLRYKMDTTFIKPLPTTVVIGQTDLIGGVRDGLLAMREGEVGDIYFTSDLGYGSKQVGPVPANSMLRFRIQILKVNNQLIENEKADIANYLTVNNVAVTAKQAQGYYFIPVNKHETPKAVVNDSIFIHYTCKALDGTVIAPLSINRLSKFMVGKGGPVVGLDLAFTLMAQHDTAKVVVPSNLAYGNAGFLNEVSPYEPLEFTVIVDSIKVH